MGEHRLKNEIPTPFKGYGAHDQLYHTYIYTMRTKPQSLTWRITMTPIDPRPAVHCFNTLEIKCELNRLKSIIRLTTI